MKNLRIFGIVFWVMLLCASLLPVSTHAQVRSTPVTIIPSAYVALSASITTSPTQPTGTASFPPLTKTVRNATFQAWCSATSGATIIINANIIGSRGLPITMKAVGNIGVRDYYTGASTTVAGINAGELSGVSVETHPSVDAFCNISLFAETSP